MLSALGCQGEAKGALESIERDKEVAANYWLLCAVQTVLSGHCGAAPAVLWQPLLGPGRPLAGGKLQKLAITGCGGSGPFSGPVCDPVWSGFETDLQLRLVNLLA